MGWGVYRSRAENRICFSDKTFSDIDNSPSAVEVEIRILFLALA